MWKVRSRKVGAYKSRTKPKTLISSHLDHHAVLGVCGGLFVGGRGMKERVKCDLTESMKILKLG